MTKKILILGINGFIGSNLTKAIIDKTDWEVYGMDLDVHKLDDSIGNKRVHFTAGDITVHKEWVAEHVKKCDVILPLVAIANPAIYVTDPLRVFRLDFAANLPIIELCVEYKKRLLFPSTSEVYGMSADVPFDEETSCLTQGPINKERWIYSCCKQLLDRVIYGYGNHGDLQFTLFRPFNWIGPKQDNISNADNNARVVTQFISNIIYGKNLQLVDGGEQKRCFTFITDAMDAMLKMLENKDGCADGRIFNIGNPENNYSIREVAEMLLAIAAKHPQGKALAEKVKIVNTVSDKYYGAGYQDVQLRVPSIENAKKYLGWQPKTKLQDILATTLDFYLSDL